MALELTPDNRPIIALLEAHCHGAYRFVHHAWVPYVRVGPAGATDPVTIRASVDLTLLGQDQVRQLQGLEDIRDFAVVFRLSGGMTLQELGRRATQLDSIDPQHPLSQRPPRAVGVGRDLVLGQPILVEPTPKPKPPPPPPPEDDPGKRQRAPLVNLPILRIPDTPATIAIPDEPTSEKIQALAAQEDVKPEIGDYLVIPEDEADQYRPLPRWVATTPYVETVHVVQPRLGVNRAVQVSDDEHA